MPKSKRPGASDAEPLENDHPATDGHSDTKSLEADQLYTIVAEWPSGRDMVRVTLGWAGDQDVIDIRRWWRHESGKLCRGKKGIMLPADQVDRLAAALTEAAAQAVRLRLRE